jgi:hypothetical protein
VKLVYFYTFGQLNRRFIYRHLGYAEMLNITKEVYQSRSNRLPKDIQRRRPQESAFRMSKGVEIITIKN